MRLRSTTTTPTSNGTLRVPGSIQRGTTTATTAYARIGVAGCRHGRTSKQRRLSSSMGGETVVALIHQQRLRGRGSGIEVDAPPYALAFVFQDGKVVRWVLYPTHTEALEAAGLTE